MKQSYFYLFFTISILSFLFFNPNTSIATSGACSSHGGVDCSMGAQIGGKVYCNDGWTESITFYDFTSKCDSSEFQCNYGYCSMPYATGCTTESDYATQSASVFKLGQSGSSYGQAQLDKCRKEISDYKSGQEDYQKCLANSETRYQNCIDLQYQRLCLSFGYSQFNNNTKNCECIQGEYRDSEYQMCFKIPTCSNNSFLNSGYKCQCNPGYVVVDNVCVLPVVKQDIAVSTQKNQSTVEESIDISPDEKITNEVQKFIQDEKEKIKNVDTVLSNRLKGKILLQIEENGEGWYVNPDNQKRYFLGRPDDAFSLMRELGLGISNKDFDSFNDVAPQKLSGKILLKVEDNGKAYYINPNDLKMHYLGRPADAFKVMRELGLGISNVDIRKVDIN